MIRNSPSDLPLVDQVAAIIAGPGAVAVFEDRVIKGKGNKGLRIFQVRTSAGCVARFIEKRSTQKKEGQLARIMAGFDKETLLELNIPAPRFYHVEHDSDLNLIFQEFLGGTRLRKVWRSGFGTAISNAAFKMSAGLDRAYKMADVEPVSIPCFRRYDISFVADKLGQDVADSLGVLTEEIREYLKDVPVIINHNDISWGNISVVRGKDKSPVVRFIDFGLVGLNYTGADLHHFARVSSETPERARFFETASLQFSTLHNLPVSKIKAAAFFYAAHRHLQRSRSAEDFCREFDVVLDFLRHAKAHGDIV